MKSEKEILNFGKKIIKEEIVSIQKVQNNLNLNFSKAVNVFPVLVGPSIANKFSSSLNIIY